MKTCLDCVHFYVCEEQEREFYMKGQVVCCNFLDRKTTVFCDSKEDFEIIKDYKRLKPQKPTVDKYEGGAVIEYICPCGADVRYKQPYCMFCGQALDWSNTEEITQTPSKEEQE